MFARSVAFQLKPGRATEFTKAMEHVIAGTPQVRTYDVQLDLRQDRRSRTAEAARPSSGGEGGPPGPPHRRPATPPQAPKEN
jgi:hypothetical protein